MTLQFFNTLTRKKEPFQPIKKGEVSIYSCGPTVYNYVHIGNLRCYVFNDLLKRFLEYKGFKLNDVMNITDIDDKTIRDSKKEGKSLKEFTEFYTKAFLDDLNTLNIRQPKVLPKATEYIKEMVDMIKQLTKNGHTYEKNGSTYFKIQSDKSYGKIANLDNNVLKQNADGRLNDADEYEKEDVRDFALWKAYDEDDGDVFWETDIGKGRPGWHIECSVMSTKNLGNTFDIHTGGVDLIFPHHTNEIAQSCCSIGGEFAKVWMHNAHLIVNGEKMSKSLGNFFTLRDLIDKGYKPNAIRYELLATHYRQQLDFREDNLKKIPETLAKFTEFLEKLDLAIQNSNVENKNPQIQERIDQAKKEFESALDDDLNISQALAAVFTFMPDINKIITQISKEDAQKVKDAMLGFDSVLAVMNYEAQSALPNDVQELVDRRETARVSKDWDEADKLRDQIHEKGYTIKDTEFGPQVKKN